MRFRTVGYQLYSAVLPRLIKSTLHLKYLEVKSSGGLGHEKKVKENQFYLQGPVPGWFMCRRGPLISPIDLPFLTSSPRPVSAPARGWLRLISVMEASEKLRTWKGWSKQDCLFVAADDDHSLSLAGWFFAYSQSRTGKGVGLSDRAWVQAQHCSWNCSTTCIGAVIQNLSHRVLLQFDFEGGVKGIWLHLYWAELINTGALWCLPQLPAGVSHMQRYTIDCETCPQLDILSNHHFAHLFVFLFYFNFFMQ